jgi:UDP-N-acetylmuramate-alanine ligase
MKPIFTKPLPVLKELKRLEKIAEGKGKVAYKDFAHSPSKVSATTKAVKINIQIEN